MSEYLIQIPNHQIVLFIIVLVLLVVQSIYWFNYKAVASHRHRYRLREDEPLPPVSLVVVVGDDPEFVCQELPKLLKQDHPQYEVVVVNDCGGGEVTEALAELAASCPHLKYTVISADDRFKHSRKIPLMVGIKAAQYNNLVFTHTDTVPGSEKWLSFMARGFVGADVVISYAGLEVNGRFANAMMRCAWLTTSIRYLRAAAGGKPYRGTMRNIGYTKEAFFRSRGFTHLRLALGEDDLLIQKIATPENTALIINPHTTMRQATYGGLKWWWGERRYYTFPYRYYPKRVKVACFVELLTRALLVKLTCAMIVVGALDLGMPGLFPKGLLVFPLATLIIGAVVLLLREVVMLNVVMSIAARLGESKIVLSYLLYDLVAPVAEALLAISRRIKPHHGLWQ